MKGMLWLMTDSKRPFPESVDQAVAHMRQKHGRLPIVVQGNKGDVGETTAVSGVPVESSAYAPPRHLLVVYER
jgi:hypothetical protein